MMTMPERQQQEPHWELMEDPAGGGQFCKAVMNKQEMCVQCRAMHTTPTSERSRQRVLGLDPRSWPMKADDSIIHKTLHTLENSLLRRQGGLHRLSA